MERKLLILGAGQFGKIVSEIANEMNCFSQIAFLDDASSEALGALSGYIELRETFTDAVVAIGNANIRLSWTERLKEAGYRIPAIVSSFAYVAPTAIIGSGCIIEPNATVQSESCLEAACIVASGAVVRHNATMKAGSCLDCNAVLFSGIVLESLKKVPALTVYMG